MFLLALKIMTLVFCLYSSPVSGEQPLIDDDPQESKIALEQAKILEKVEHDYNKALERYQKLNQAGASVSIMIREKAVLGEARCLVKLGKYQDAVKRLEELINTTKSDETKVEAKTSLRSVNNLSAINGAGTPSSVDILVIQLIEAASGTDKDLASRARTELYSMGEIAVPMLARIAEHADYFQSVKAFNVLCAIGGPQAESFMSACCSDDDLSLRKRALDGFCLIYWNPVHEGVVEVFAQFITDDNLSLRIKAMTAMSDEVKNLSNERCSAFLDRYIDPIITQCSDKRFRGLDLKVLRTALKRLVNEDSSSNDEKPVKPFPLADKTISSISRLLDLKLDQLHEYDDFDSWCNIDTLRESVITLGHSYNQRHLLEKMAKLWSMTDKDALYAAFNAAEILGVNAVEEIFKQTLAEKDPDKIIYLTKGVCSVELFRKLPFELQHAYLYQCGQSLKGFYYSCPLLTEELTPKLWSTLVKGVLDNGGISAQGVCDILANSQSKRRPDGTKFNGFKCPDPNDPDCIKVLCLWASYSDPDVAKSCLSTVSRLVHEQNMDPGPEAALSVFSNFIVTHPDEVDRVINIIFSPGKNNLFIEHPKLLEWLMSQDDPGFYNELAIFNNNHRTSKNPILFMLEKGHQHIIDLWFKTSPKGRENIFQNLYPAFNFNVDPTQGKWFLPVFAKWSYEGGWKSNNIRGLIDFISNKYDSALVGRVEEVIVAFLENPKALSQSTLDDLLKLIDKASADTDVVYAYIPTVYKAVGSNYARARHRGLEGTISQSTKNINRVMKWIQEDNDDSFKWPVLRALFLGEKAPTKTYFHDLETALLNTWPKLDKDTQKLLLTEFVKFFESWRGAKYGGKFLITCFEDPTLEPDFKHLAYAALLISGDSDAVDPLLEYMKSLKPGEGEGNLHEQSSNTVFASKVLKNCFYHLNPDKLDYYDIFNRYPNPFPPEAKKRLYMGILSLPADKAPFACNAARNIAIENKDDLSFLRSIMNKPFSGKTREYLLNNIVSHDIQSEWGDRERTVDLLRKILSGQYSESDNNKVIESAFGSIGYYKIEELRPETGEAAMNHSSFQIRYAAIPHLKPSIILILSHIWWKRCGIHPN